MTFVSFNLSTPKRVNRWAFEGGKSIGDPLLATNLGNLRGRRGTCTDTDTDTLMSLHMIYMTCPVIMPLGHNAILGAGSAGSDTKSNTPRGNRCERGSPMTLLNHRVHRITIFKNRYTMLKVKTLERKNIDARYLTSYQKSNRRHEGK